MFSVARSAGFASCKTFGKQPKRPCLGRSPKRGEGGSPTLSPFPRGRGLGLGIENSHYLIINRLFLQAGRSASAGRFCVLFVYTAQGIYRKRRKNGVSGIIFEYFLKIRRKRLNICADLCYTYNVVYSASEEYILADSGNNIVNNTP